MKKIFTLFAVAAMVFAAQANVITVAEGSEANFHFPINGLYYDTERTISQMIYPEFMLTDLVGAEISELKFYARDPIALSGGSFQLSMKVVPQTEFATASAIVLAEDDVYGTGTAVPGVTEFVITLDRPFVYEGGNLLIETKVIIHGNYSTTAFYGITTGLYGGFFGFYNMYGAFAANTEAFLPQVTFTIGDSQFTLGDVNGDGVVNVTDATMLIGLILVGDPLASDYPAGDMNQDGVLNVSDVNMLINQALTGD